MVARGVFFLLDVLGCSSHLWLRRCNKDRTRYPRPLLLHCFNEDGTNPMKRTNRTIHSFPFCRRPSLFSQKLWMATSDLNFGTGWTELLVDTLHDGRRRSNKTKFWYTHWVSPPSHLETSELDTTMIFLKHSAGSPWSFMATADVRLEKGEGEKQWLFSSATT